MPSALQMMLSIVEAHITGKMTPEQIAQAIEQQRERPLERQQSVGILPLHGPIFPKANMMTQLSGATSLDQWTSQFMQMVEDDSITSIILDVDSPGGSSAMIPETAALIRESREVKPIYAVANVMAGSAAYGLAAQATKLFASPSSLVGSAGTYMVHTDESQLAQKLGVVETVIKEGRFKAVELESLTPDAKAYLQEFVGDVNDVFLNEIAAGRNTDADSIRALEAKVFNGVRAVEVGLADEVASFDEVLADTIAGGGNHVGIAVAQSVSGTAAVGGVSLVPQPRASYDADKEHSEPGTGLGGEPTPREPPEEGDPMIVNGWRRDSPPAAFDPPEEAVNREWLETQATSLGIEFNQDTTDEELAQSVATAVEAIVVPLNAATEVATQQRQFAEMFPEQAAALEALQRQQREGAAAAFAAQYERFDGQSRGFSPVVREQIEMAHEQIASRQFSHADLAQLLDTVTSEAAVVRYGEQGSSRQSAGDTTTTVGVPSGDFKKDRETFTGLVSQAMTDDNLSRDAALAHVAEQYPDLYNSFRYGHVK